MRIKAIHLFIILLFITVSPVKAQDTTIFNEFVQPDQFFKHASLNKNLI
jgi:hypothetical protein